MIGDDVCCVIFLLRLGNWYYSNAYYSNATSADINEAGVILTRIMN